MSGATCQVKWTSGKQDNTVRPMTVYVLQVTSEHKVLQLLWYQESEPIEQSRVIKCELNQVLFESLAEISPCLNFRLVISHDCYLC